MSFLPGIFDKRVQQQQPQGQQQAPNQGQQQQQQPAKPVNFANAQPTGNNPANTVNSPDSSGTPNAGGPQNPLDQFSDYFKPRQVDPNAPKKLSMTDPLLGDFEPTKLRESVAGINFAQGVNPELFQKALSGDANALAEAMSAVAREAFVASAQVSHKFVESGVRTGADRMLGDVDSRFHKLTLQQQTPKNEQLNHPAIKPMADALRLQFANANPNESAQQIQQRVEEYLTQVASVLSPQQQSQQQTNQQQPTNTGFADLLS